MSTETTQSSALDTLGSETRTFPPPADFTRQANASDQGIYERADKDFEGFWAEHARTLSWRRPFTTGLSSRPSLWLTTVSGAHVPSPEVSV